MGYIGQNNETIKRALARLAVEERSAAKAAMERALEQAINYAMEIHQNDSTHHEHEDLNCAYGWLVTHKNREVSRGYYDGGDDSVMNFKAWMDKELDTIAGSHRSDAWLGFLVVAQPEFFDYDFEEGVLHATADKLAEDFPVYFKFMTRAAL